ncbi:hypothetical protein CPB85DRAFT_1254917 [Mucidula mucida]|nr:hypothetical protein CPB85DRAFT_1254917 [Mucidula mucida]
MMSIFTFNITVGSHQVTAALADLYTHFALVLPYEVPDGSSNPLESSPIIAFLTTLSYDNPVPQPSPDGKMRFCMKPYSENEGLLPQLTQLGVLQRAPGLAELQNGPIVDVLLDNSKISHACLKCTRPGLTGAVFEHQDAPRLQCCSKCKTAYYCDAQCQKDDWKVHKKDCNLWRTNRPEAMRIMENARRADMSAFLGLS